MFNLPHEDQMKVAILNELVNKYNIKHHQVEEDEGPCMLYIEGNVYCAIRSGKIRYFANENKTMGDLLKDYKSDGTMTTALLYIIKAWLKKTDQLED